MKHALSMIALSVALAATCGSPGVAHAAPDAADNPASVFGPGLHTVDAAVLAQQRGGTDVHDMQLSKIWADGKVSEVQAYDLVTGHNVIADGSLAGAAGMPMVVQNSGNGVLIQNAVILNVEVR